MYGIICILTCSIHHSTQINRALVEIFRMQLSFSHMQLPGICPFQEMNYTITIQQISPTHNTLSTAGQADNIIVIGPKMVTSHTSVLEIVNSSLVVDAVYSVHVRFDTLAANVSSTTTFGKYVL